MSGKAVLAQALKLPKNQRIKLAQQLIESAIDDDVLVAGARLADQRWQAYKRGETGAKPAREAIEALVKRKLRK